MFLQKEILAACKQINVGERVFGVELLLQVFDCVPDPHHVNQVFTPYRFQDVRFHKVHERKHLLRTIRWVN